MLDSRYINQSNDTVVSEWTDRSGNANNAAQATALQQPRFITAVVGGNGVVRFDGSNDFLSIPDSDTLDSSTYIHIFAGYRMRQSSSVGTIVGKRRNDAAGTYNYALYSISLTNYCTFGESSPVQDNYGVLSAAEVTNTNYIFNYSYKQNSFNAFRNGTSQSTSQLLNGSATISGNSATFQIGNGPSSGIANQWPASVDLFFVYFLKDEITTALRKRTEHAAAYSFKIACS